MPYKIHTILTDNGIQFRYPSRHANGIAARYMIHMFDMHCREFGIDHRFTKVNHPWTNGQVERMNRTIKEATVKRYHYDDHDQLRGHLDDFMNKVTDIWFEQYIGVLNISTIYEAIRGVFGQKRTWCSNDRILCSQNYTISTEGLLYRCDNKD